MKRRHPQAWIYVTADRWRSGIPDVLMCHHGRFIALEVKTPRGRLAPIQRVTLEHITRAGGIAHVVCTVEEALAWMR